MVCEDGGAAVARDGGPRSTEVGRMLVLWKENFCRRGGGTD